MQNIKRILHEEGEPTPPANVQADIDTTPTKMMNHRKILRRRKKNGKSNFKL